MLRYYSQVKRVEAWTQKQYSFRHNNLTSGSKHAQGEVDQLCNAKNIGLLIHMKVEWINM